ncbi:MAG: adenosylcobinamide-GDP ribazoletransferase [Ruminococcaceae bacterium]|jgi:adenosylcobinamide-GDP ribazoletransferase|nr:adenosylcobinamide-GDP ribazoletransferase [Oscillospiraceae bacterium]
MKRYAQAFAMCQTMFCTIPCPGHVWEEKARPLMLLFLPVVGLEIGAIWYAAAWLVAQLSLPVPIAALLLCACPYGLTGAIHLDGFMDVVDAVRSCAAPERRREILKDPHVGSFAAIGCALLLLSGYSVFSVSGGDIRLLLFIPVVSRCCSALSVTLLPPMSTSQYAAQKIDRRHAAVLLVMLAAAIALGFVYCGKGAFALLIESAGYGLALLRAHRNLGGMNGDIAGYALTVAELCGAAAFALL